MAYQAGRLRSDQRGGVAAIFAIVIPLLLMAAGMALDLARLRSDAAFLQEAVDSAALAAGKEMSLTDVNQQSLASVAAAKVETMLRSRIDNKQMPMPEVSLEARSNPISVLVTASIPFKSMFGAFGLGNTSVARQAEARVVGNPNICVLALEPSEALAIWLVDKANMRGQKCSIFSNSRSSNGLAVQGSATLSASSVCSSGGVTKGGVISPSPYTDCPQFSDPLAGRTEPKLAGCTYMNLVIDNETRTLAPGSYCGGLTIKGNSRVTFQPGDHLIGSGLFTVRDTAVISGEGVSFYLDQFTWMMFGPSTTIQLTASKKGPMAGLLFFGSRSQPKLFTHTILSRNAQLLTGTIYLPRNSFVVDGDAAVGGSSAYTAIVARRVVLLAGPELVLNTNYDQTDVPVPEGIRGATQPVVLSR